MYDLISSINEGGSPVTKLQLAWQVKAGHTDPPQSQTHSDPPQSLDTPTPQSAVDYQYVDAFYMGEVTPSGHVLAVEERPGRHTLMQLLSREGKVVKIATIESEKSGDPRVETLFISEYRGGCYGIGVQGGRVLIVREDLHISAAFNVVSVLHPYSEASSVTVLWCKPFTRAPHVAIVSSSGNHGDTTLPQGVTARTCVWDGDCLVLPSDSGALLWWSTSGVKVKEVKIGSPDYLVRLDWSVSGQSLWVCGFSALRLLSVTRDKQGEGGREELMTR